MRHHLLLRFNLFSFILISIVSCSSEKEELATAQVKDYVNLAPGKYITYRLDSLVITNYNKNIEIHGYQQKDVIDAVITDNLGRPSYRVYRYLRDSLGNSPWQSIGTYQVTLLDDQLEVLEDNLRFIKLHMPARINFSWKGNRYLPSEPYEPKYPFNNDASIQDWQFYYDSIDEDFSYGGKSYPDVLSVEQINDSLNMPVTSTAVYGYKSKGIEKYQKGVGLVYQEYTLVEYQPGSASYWGFGVKRWMIDHN
jgi:hypothetical protein